jgi:steroid 5-alpha reductase family enzyme
MSFSSLQGLQYLTLISPIFTYLLLVYVSGVRMLEARGDLKWGDDPDYQNYKKSTPTLFFKFF